MNIKQRQLKLKQILSIIKRFKKMSQTWTQTDYNRNRTEVVRFIRAVIQLVEIRCEKAPQNWGANWKDCSVDYNNTTITELPAIPTYFYSKEQTSSNQEVSFYNNLNCEIYPFKAFNYQHDITLLLDDSDWALRAVIIAFQALYSDSNASSISFGFNKEHVIIAYAVFDIYDPEGHINGYKLITKGDRSFVFYSDNLALDHYVSENVSDIENLATDIFLNFIQLSTKRKDELNDLMLTITSDTERVQISYGVMLFDSVNS